jgi:uncharacterized membrane protein YeaQ/YmgE (transglycosylase-associated protein family)
VTEALERPETRRETSERLSVFGSVDGLSMFLGITIGLIVAHHGESSTIWHAALGGAGGELAGMTAGQHLSDPDSGWLVAIVCGIAGALACVLPAFPYIALSGSTALAAALGIAVLVACCVAWLRPERGVTAVARTFAVLAAAGLLSGLSGLI